MIAEAQIRFALEDSPHLEPIFFTSNSFPQRVKEIDESCFIVFNNKREQFELHSMDSYFPSIEGVTTHQMVLPDLEEKTLEKILYGSHKINGYDVHDEMHRSEKIHTKSINEIHKQSISRATNSFIDDISGRKKVY